MKTAITARQASAAGWAFLLGQFALLALVATTTQRSLPLDVLEQIGWARDPQWTYYKHPPLPAWVLAGVLDLSGYRLWTAALVGPLFATLALWLVWRLARRILEPGAAVLSMLLLGGVVFFNFASFEFNHNVVQLPLWAALGLLGHRVLREGRTADWIGLGAVAALGMLGKYSTVLMLVSLLAGFLAAPQGRRRLLSPGVFVACGVGLLFLAPHLIALWRIDFLPFRFPFERARSATTVFDHLLFPLSFLASQAVSIGGLLLLTLLLHLGSEQDPAPPVAISRDDRLFVGCIALGPVGLALLMQAVTALRFRDMWGAPMWDFAGLLAMMVMAGRRLQPRSLARFATALAGVVLLLVAARAGANTLKPVFGRKPDRVQFPAAPVAQAIEAGWHGLAGADRPLGIVVADLWLGGLMTAYAPDHPSEMIDASRVKSPWITCERLKAAGAVLLWRPTAQDGGSPLLGRFPHAVPQPPVSVPYGGFARRSPDAAVAWAYLPPGTDDCPQPEVPAPEADEPAQ